MKRIALTGGIACGKSTLAQMLAELGCDVLDTDAVVHALEGPGGAAVKPIAEAFGPRMRAADGGVDRTALGNVVFADAAARTRLNGIVHPLVQERLRQWLAASRAAIQVAVVPLLHEVGWSEGWDAIVCVACQPAEQIRRMQARGLSIPEAQARFDSQLPLEEKIRRSTHVVWNDADREALRAEARRLTTLFSENMP